MEHHLHETLAEPAQERRDDEGREPLVRRHREQAALQEEVQRKSEDRPDERPVEAEAKEREEARRTELRAAGGEPRDPSSRRDPFKPKPSEQRNFTDPDSKIMKTSDGAYHQCYNGQAIVDARAQVIVACELSDEAPDARQLEPALDQLADNLEAIGAELPAAATLTADAGYFSEGNVRITARHGRTTSSGYRGGT